jgi:hypothetical protein
MDRITAPLILRRRTGMKKSAALTVVAAFVFFLAVPVLVSGNEDDLKVIKKAVRGSSCDSGKPMKRFRVLISDKKSGGDVVKLTLPISLRKMLCHGSKDGHRHAGHVDKHRLAAIKDLEKCLPLTLLEIVDDGAKVKIWLE